MAKATESDYQEHVAETRHDELIRSLKAIAERPGVDAVVQETLTVLKAIESKETPSLDIQPLIKELSAGIAKLEKAISVKPKAMIIHRTTIGLIEKVTLEY